MTKPLRTKKIDIPREAKPATYLRAKEEPPYIKVMSAL
jgi:hypothetical protein